MRSGTELSQFLGIFPTYSCMLKDFLINFTQVCFMLDIEQMLKKETVQMIAFASIIGKIRYALNNSCIYYCYIFLYVFFISR